MELRKQKNDMAISKLDKAKTAMQKRETVCYDDKPYIINAIRLCNSAVYGGLIYQAEIVSAEPERWNHAYYVALDAIEFEGDGDENNGD